MRDASPARDSAPLQQQQPAGSASPLAQHLEQLQRDKQQLQAQAEQAQGEVGRVQAEAEQFQFQQQQQQQQAAEAIAALQNKEQNMVQSQEQMQARNAELEKLNEQQRLAAQLEMETLAGKLQEQTNLYNNSVRQNEEIKQQVGALQGGKDIADRQSATIGSEKDAVERNLAQLQQQLDGAQGQVKDQIGALQEKDHQRQMLA